MKDYNEEALIRSLREYKKEQQMKNNYAGLFMEIRTICEAARSVGFDEIFVQNLALNLAMVSITGPNQNGK